ncbi:MAG: hypothetical protein ACFE8L_01145, partial [Candidatus Hodarchaeota archaeon]
MRLKRLKKRIRCLLLLLFTLIFPLLLNTNIFSSNSGLTNNIDDDHIGETHLSAPSSSLPNADYYDYYKVITIDHTKVSGTGTHINFPVLISILDSDLHEEAQSDGDDIAFANNTDWLDHEIELYNPSYTIDEAQLIAWVRIPLLSTSVDTNIFMFYGNDTISSQENPTGVWENNYMGVWHLKDDPGYGGSVQDSTINSNHGTAINMESQDQVPGQIDGSLRFNGFNEYVSVGNVGPQIKTIEFWMNPDSLGSIESFNTGYQSPSATGNQNEWFNPAGAYTNDGNRATEATNYDDQDWRDFNFNIPAGATIQGILVSIEASTSVQYQSTGCWIRLSHNGGFSYTTPKSQSWSSTFDSYRTVGSSSDTWGRTWSPSDFSNSNFRIWLEKSGSTSATLRVDHIRIIVYYSLTTDTVVIDFDGTDHISIGHSSGEIKAISFPSTSTIYHNGITGSIATVGTLQHVVITNPTGITASALD